MRFNYSFSTKIDVRSRHRNGDDITAGSLIAALEERLARARKDPGALVAEFASTHDGGKPLWALASATLPNVMMKANRSWVEVDQAMIDPGDLVMTKEALARPLPADCVWRLPDLLGTDPVLAKIQGSVSGPERLLDLASWLATERAPVINDFLQDDFASPEARAAIRDMHNIVAVCGLKSLGEPVAVWVTAMIHTSIRLEFDRGEALTWLEQNRPDVLAVTPAPDLV